MRLSSLTYKQNVAQVVSQAAIHLHNSLGSIGTALIDSFGNLVFDNDALGCLNDEVISMLVMRCLNNPNSTGIDHTVDNDLLVWAIPLDAQHIFLIVGSQLEPQTINRFVSNLRRVMPKAPVTHD
jgi:hypothetical protein